MKRFLMWLGLAVIALALVAISIFLASLTKGSPDLPGWVQAVGSIAAIVAAFGLSYAQLREQRMHERKREKEDAQRKIRTLCSLLGRVKELSEIIAKSERPVPDEHPQYAAIYDLGLLQALLEKLPIFEVPMDELILRFHRIQQLIPMLCREFNQFRELEHPQDADKRRTARSSARRHLEELGSATNKLIQLCDQELGRHSG